ASYLNSQFRGYTLGDIRKALLDIVYQEMAMRDWSGPETPVHQLQAVAQAAR
ncbi:MAG: hypothetical protein HQL03_05730, partial [Nitrospirae bacterium]|nr:hypothetical protein [Nitrospirota bacterium]